jgi:ribosome-associated protein
MDEPISKSQKKRQAYALQKLGLELVNLKHEKLDALPLPDNLHKAIVDAKTITSHGAKRRQAQWIGKLMRAADFEAIQSAYQAMLEEESSLTANFHEIELWREKLINGGKPALTEFLNRYQPEDIQHLQQLIKKAVQEQLKQTQAGAAKALFRYLRLSIQ